MSAKLPKPLRNFEPAPPRCVKSQNAAFACCRTTAGGIATRTRSPRRSRLSQWDLWATRRTVHFVPGAKYHARGDLGCRPSQGRRRTSPAKSFGRTSCSWWRRWNSASLCLYCTGWSGVCGSTVTRHGAARVHVAPNGRFQPPQHGHLHEAGVHRPPPPAEQTAQGCGAEPAIVGFLVGARKEGRRDKFQRGLEDFVRGTSQHGRVALAWHEAPIAGRLLCAGALVDQRPQKPLPGVLQQVIRDVGTTLRQREAKGMTGADPRNETMLGDSQSPGASRESLPW